jgi:hypothetical protein
MEPTPRNDDDMFRRAMLEQEQMVIEALARCARAGASPNDLKLLAGSLGVSRYLAQITPYYDQTRTR